MTTLADVRGDIVTALETVDAVEVYRRRPTNLHFPAFVVGWPQSLDVNAALGGTLREYVIPVDIGVEVTDDESADILLEELVESAVTALQDSQPTWTVRPATESGEQVTADSRTIIWYRLPVEVYG